MWVSDIGGGRARQHPSKMGALPNIVLSILVLDLPLPSTTSSTRSPRSCHLTVAGDRIALPASMTRRPAVVAGPVDSAGTPQSAYTTGGQASAPCQHSYRASILRGTDQHELPWLGNAVPTASSTPSASSGSGGIRQSDGLLRVARRRRFHVTLVAIGSRLDHEASDNSFRGTSPPRPLPSPWGNDSCNCNWRADDRPRDHVKACSPSRVPSATSRRHVELSCTRTLSWAVMRVLPARRQVAGVPHWHAQRLLTQRRGDTAVAPALGASAQGVPAPSGFLVLKTLTESTAPARPVPPPQAEDTGPSGAQVASAHCAGRPVLV